MNSVFVLACSLSHTGLGYRAGCTPIVSAELYQAWFGVVNLDPGSLESKEGSKLVLIGTLFLPLTLAQAPLGAIGCLKLVTAVVFQPLFRGQHTDFT